MAEMSTLDRPSGERTTRTSPPLARRKRSFQGTTELPTNLIGERVLGLPRQPETT
jgi:hypothetical protein